MEPVAGVGEREAVAGVFRVGDGCRGDGCRGGGKVRGVGGGGAFACVCVRMRIWDCDGGVVVEEQGMARRRRMYSAAADRDVLHADADLELEEEVAPRGRHGHDAGVKGDDGVAGLQLLGGGTPGGGFGGKDDLLGVIWKGKEDCFLDDAGPRVEGETVDGIEGNVVDPEGTEELCVVED